MRWVQVGGGAAGGWPAGPAPYWGGGLQSGAGWPWGGAVGLAWWDGLIGDRAGQGGKRGCLACWPAFDWGGRV